MSTLIADPFRAARLILSLRRQGVTDDAVLSALETVDRGVFVSPDLADMGAEDCALPIACGQTLPRPIITAQLLRALQVSPGKEDKVLLIGAGSGYTAALLAQTCRHVYGVERYAALTRNAQHTLEQLQVDNVTLRHGDGLVGLSAHGPFDRILLTGAVTVIPAVLMEQLDRDGLLVAPIEASSGEQVLRCVSGAKAVKDEPMAQTVTRLRPGIAAAL
ncbi:MAG: methyltransferase domain-containing protein [Pseudomonadota bacterium]